jgi:phasin family protein
MDRLVAYQANPFTAYNMTPDKTGEDSMAAQFEDFQKLAKDNMDVVTKSLGTTTKGVQAIASEMTEYSKKAFEQGSAVAEKLAGAKTLDKAVEIQTEYAKSAYEGFVAYASKLGELYTNLAKETVKPYEGLFAKVSAVATAK